MKNKVEYLVNISFEEVSIPPFRDILVLGIKCPQGKLGITKCYQLLSIDDFTIVDINKYCVGYVLINNRLLKKMPQEQILEILENDVFPYMSEGETMKVDFNLEIFVKNIKVSNNN